MCIGTDVPIKDGVPLPKKQTRKCLSGRLAAEEARAKMFKPAFRRRKSKSGALKQGQKFSSAPVC